MRRSGIVLVLALACAAPRALGPDARTLEGAGCVKVGEVTGVGVGGWGTTRDLQLYWATSEAYKFASEMGATDVAFVNETGDQNLLVLEGIAYRCP
jgi:hypothetical protein